MPEGTAKEPRKMPKGVKRGGKRFPQYPLNDAVKWAEKLVSKTHSGPQPQDLIKASVVEAKSGVGDVRISALKQFDLLTGTSKGYSATELAKELRSAPPEEKRPLYQRAALKPDIFNAIYETYHGDSVNFSKLKQRAADLQIHPDAAPKCVEVYVETMEFAGLISREGDLFSHADKGNSADFGEEFIGSDGSVINDDRDVSSSGNDLVDNVAEAQGTTRRGVATVQVNISLDSSLDTDKLQKQLELLRRYGAL